MNERSNPAPKQRLARAELYRKAAQRVLTRKDSCCCWSLQDVGLGCNDFDKYFYWGGSELRWDSGWNWGYLCDDNQLAKLQRTLALCLMAAMVEAGDA